jgi:asparagine synthetase B (glutamine-hydrolysing)
VSLRQGARLLIAADGTGMKSVYYYRSPLDGILCFASELGALFRFRGVPRELLCPSRGELFKHLFPNRGELRIVHRLKERYASCYQIS